MTCVQTLDYVIDVYCQYKQCSALYLLTFFFFSCPVGRVLQRGVPQRGEPIVSSQIPATDVYQEMAPNTFTEPTALSNRSRYRPAQAGHFPQ